MAELYVYRALGRGRDYRWHLAAVLPHEGLADVVLAIDLARGFCLDDPLTYDFPFGLPPGGVFMGNPWRWYAAVTPYNFIAERIAS